MLYPKTRTQALVAKLNTQGAAIVVHETPSGQVVVIIGKSRTQFASWRAVETHLLQPEGWA